MNPNAATLRLAVLPRSGLLADVLLVAAGAGLVALTAQFEIKLWFTPVPITGQTFAVLLVGASLGALRGMTSLTLYFLLGLVGVPVYAGGESGWEWVEGATGGFLLGFIAAAAIAGWLAERRWDRRFSSATGAMLAASVVIYLVGLPWLAAVANLSFEETLTQGLAPFIPGDLVKLYLAAVVLPGGWWLVRRFRGER